jgi:hypothetical protein
VSSDGGTATATGHNGNGNAIAAGNSSVLEVGEDGRVLSVSGAAASASGGPGSGAVREVGVGNDGSTVACHWLQTPAGGWYENGSTTVSDGGRTSVHRWSSTSTATSTLHPNDDVTTQCMEVTDKFIHT